MKFRHFPLHPETPAEGMTLDELFRERGIDIPAAQRRMATLMREEGLPYGNRTMTFNSRLAQELAAWADRQPGGDQIHNALFRAYFVQGRNIAEVDTLLGVAEQVGLPASAARDVLESRSCSSLVDDDWDQARRLRLTSVPSFIVGSQGVVGAQPFEVLEKLVVGGGAQRRRDGDTF